MFLGPKILLQNCLKCDFLILSKFCSKPVPRTAAVVVIGDEVLKGQVGDKNTQIFCKGLRNFGVKVVTAAVLPDDVSFVAAQIRYYSKKYTYVLTSGGIGPTHDDITFKAIAEAFNEPLILHSEIFQVISNLYKDDKKIEAGKKMAMVPKSSKLTYGIDPETGLKSRFPNISVNNVYIFPGIPKFTQYLFTLVAEQHFGNIPRIQFHQREIFLDIPEVDVVDTLNKIVQLHTNVSFGSYPEFNNRYYSVKLTLESIDPLDVVEADTQLRQEFGQNIVQYDPNPVENSRQKLQVFLDAHPQYKPIITSLQNWLKQVKSPKLLFDGSIESMLLLHLCYVFGTKLVRVFYETNLDEKSLQFIHETSELYSDFSIVPISEIKLSQLEQGDILGSKVLSNYSKNDICDFVRGLSLPYCDET